VGERAAQKHLHGTSGVGVERDGFQRLLDSLLFYKGGSDAQEGPRSGTRDLGAAGKLPERPRAGTA
jgi:hypothetical protein